VGGYIIGTGFFLLPYSHAPVPLFPVPLFAVPLFTHYVAHLPPSTIISCAKSPCTRNTCDISFFVFAIACIRRPWNLKGEGLGRVYY
jgi:hypothetical protein